MSQQKVSSKIYIKLECSHETPVIHWVSIQD